jgi:phosphoglycolate phosphatase
MSSSLPPVLLFDFDGVIADSFEIFHGEFAQAMLDFGYAHLSQREAVLKLFESNLLSGLIRAGFPFYRLRQLGRAFGPRMSEAARSVLPFHGMPELITAFARRHPVYIVTSNTTETTQLLLDTFAVQGVRDVLGADKEASKVRKIRQLHARYPGHQPFYIGDTKGDMLEAREAGAVPVAVTWGWHSEELLRSAEPRHVVRTPAELAALFEVEENIVDAVDAMNTVDTMD